MRAGAISRDVPQELDNEWPLSGQRVKSEYSRCQLISVDINVFFIVNIYLVHFESHSIIPLLHRVRLISYF